ncbi:MAG: lysylphosphatidylglycerol synthase transmembrane domain-containing protein [Kiritimatiellia bacterium]|jgi:uncharacterized protein (TIRG00374 family)
MKPWQKNVLKLSFTALLLALLYRKVDVDGFLETLRGARLWPLALFFVVCVVNMWLSSSRWRLLLRADGLDIPTSKLFVSHWIASFFNFFMPSNIGGDVYRIADIAKKSGKPVNTVASVFADRLTGFIAMSLLGFVFPLVGLREVPPEHRWKLAIPLVVFLGFLAAAALVWQQGILRTCAHLLPGKLRTKVEDVLARFLESVRQYGKDPTVLPRCLGLSLLFQFLVVVAVFCVGTSLRLGIPFFSYCVFVPLVCLLESVPSTINGLGFRDAGYIMFFSAVGLPDPVSTASAMSLLYMTLTLLYASCGGLLFLRRNWKSGT